MTIRIHFAGLAPGRSLAHLAWAAFSRDDKLAGTTTMHFGRELADAFDRHWSVAATSADCDVVVYPHEYEDGPETERVAAEAKAVGKPCLFFGTNETLPPSRLRYGTLYRCSIFQKLPHERIIPAFINDPRRENEGRTFAPLPWEPRPRIGFCGYVGTRIGRLMLRAAGATQKVDGLMIRAAALASLRRDPRIDCDFIARSTYLGHATYAAFDNNHRLAHARHVYLENLFRCPYNLAIRGKGNHSVRLYEILAAGRIPLFVNTHCVLPLENEVNWKSHTLWIEADELRQGGDIVVAAHSSKTTEDFQDIQAANRDFWVRRLTPVPFFDHVLAAVASGGPAP